MRLLVGVPFCVFLLMHATAAIAQDASAPNQATNTGQDFFRPPQNLFQLMKLDAYIYYYFMATGVTPAMEEKMIGRGSQYAEAARDANGDPLDGGKNYKLRLPPNIPVKEFWSVIIYSNQTRSMLQTNQQYPSVSSQNKNLLMNADGSVDVHFGAMPPQGKENNWIETVPDKGWNVMLRLYSPLEPWFDKSWRPGEIERIG